MVGEQIAVAGALVAEIDGGLVGVVDEVAWPATAPATPTATVRPTAVMARKTCILPTAKPFYEAMMSSVR